MTSADRNTTLCAIEAGCGGRRLLFQQVPEPRTVENRLHLDLHAGPDLRDGEVARLRELGATVLQEVKYQGPSMSSWPTLKAPSSASSSDAVRQYGE